TTLCKPFVRETRFRASACKKKGKLCLECDEMWSFVGKSQEKVWASFRQGFTASGISSMCGVLYRFLGGLQESAPQ
ncbi:MAG: transposase, partial [Pseudomonadota bacterium]